SHSHDGILDELCQSSGVNSLHRFDAVAFAGLSPGCHDHGRRQDEPVCAYDDGGHHAQADRPDDPSMAVTLSLPTAHTPTSPRAARPPTRQVPFMIIVGGPTEATSRPYARVENIAEYAPRMRASFHQAPATSPRKRGRHAEGEVPCNWSS